MEKMGMRTGCTGVLSVSMNPLSPFDVIIPARFGAVRLPGKPLLDVAGKPLIVRVLEAASSSRAERVIVATDDERIADCVTANGGLVQLTSADHPSGTDRIAEAVDALSMDDDRIIINVQGDEPDMPGVLVDQVAALLQNDHHLGMSTAATPIHQTAEWQDPSVVKVVSNIHGHALYFSRAPIPAGQGDDASSPASAMRHIGIYGYRAGFVRQFTQWPRGALEIRERLEQLRALHNGEKIAVCEACAVPGPGVDTQADLQRVRKLFSET